MQHINQIHLQNSMGDASISDYEQLVRELKEELEDKPSLEVKVDDIECRPVTEAQKGVYKKLSPLYEAIKVSLADEDKNETYKTIKDYFNRAFSLVIKHAPKKIRTKNYLTYLNRAKALENKFELGPFMDFSLVEAIEFYFRPSTPPPKH